MKLLKYYHFAHYSRNIRYDFFFFICQFMLRLIIDHFSIKFSYKISYFGGSLEIHED